MSNPVLGIAGWKNSGKTTLVERLVAELTRRGRKVSTVKHAHHNFEIDHEGRDSFRHRAAGAAEVAVVSGRRWAIVHELRDEAEPALGEILEKLAPCDLVLVEGYKQGVHPRIEVRREGARDTAPLGSVADGFVALATDIAGGDEDRPVFHLDDIVAIADFAERYARSR